METIFLASIAASFLAGMVALFAPCCISVLLPSYLASAFRQKKHVMKMTFFFFIGIATIIVPIGLGAAWLAELFANYHSSLYFFGGALMIGLGIMSVMGKGLSIIPMPKNMGARAIQDGDQHPKSVFLLGMFSGASTSCCAPVLAGAISLAVLSGVFWKAIIVTFAYVFGMTFPLFLIAYFYESFSLENSRIIRGKILEFSLFGKKRFFHSTNLIAGAVFLTMGAIFFFMVFSGNVYWSPDFQAKIEDILFARSQQVLEEIANIPDMFWGVIFLAFLSFFIYKAIRKSNNQD